MGIRFLCPNGHKLNVKVDLAGKRASCPECGAKLLIPAASPEPDSDPAVAIVVERSPSLVSVPEPDLDHATAESVVSEAIVSDPSAPTASTYAFQRRHSKRMQFALAVVMLVAVIVLAGVLVWVVRMNANTTSQTSRSDQLPFSHASAANR